MRALAIILVLGFTGSCGYIADEAASGAGAECQRILDEEVPKIENQIWSQCSDLIDEIKGSVDDQISNVIDEMEAWFDQRLKDLETEYMTRFGCIADGTLAGWDCTDTGLCRQM